MTLTQRVGVFFIFSAFYAIPHGVRAAFTFLLGLVMFLWPTKQEWRNGWWRRF